MIHTYILTYIHTYIHTYVHTYIHTYIHTHIHTCVYRLHTHIYVYIVSYDDSSLEVSKNQSFDPSKLQGDPRFTELSLQPNVPSARRRDAPMLILVRFLNKSLKLNSFVANKYCFVCSSETRNGRGSRQSYMDPNGPSMDSSLTSSRWQSLAAVIDGRPLLPEAN